MSYIKDRFKANIFLVMIVYFMFQGNGVMSRKERSNAIDQYKKLKEIDTGMHEDDIDMEFLKKMSLNELNDRIQAGYDQLQCNYAYRVLLHIQLFEALLSIVDNTVGISMEVIRFTEINKILAVLHDKSAPNEYNVNPDVRNAIWIYYMYDLKLSKVTKRTSVDFETLQRVPFIKALEAVKSIFTDFTKTDPCGNWFEEFYEIENAVDLSTLGRLQFGSVVDINNILTGIARNKNELSEQMTYNTQYGIMVERPNRFWYNRLCMNGAIKDQQFLKDLCVFKVIPESFQPLIDFLHTHYEVVLDYLEPLHKQIKSLTVFQHNFIQLMKTIMVRIVWKHFLYLKKIQPIKVISLSNDGIHDILKGFIKYFHLKDDVKLMELCDLIKHPLVYAFLKNEIQTVLDKVVELLDDISSKLDVHVNCSEPVLVPDKFEAQNLINELRDMVRKHDEIKPSKEKTKTLVRESILSAEVFFFYIHKILISVDFGLINSFMGVSESTLFTQLEELEKNV